MMRDFERQQLNRKLEQIKKHGAITGTRAAIEKERSKIGSLVSENKRKFQMQGAAFVKRRHEQELDK